MKPQKRKARQSAGTLFTLISLLLDEPKKQKELVELSEKSESYISRLIKERTDVFCVKAQYVPLGESRNLVGLKINDYLTEWLTQLTFSEQEKARLYGIFENSRKQYAKVLQKKKQVYLDILNLNPVNFLNDPFWIILTQNPIRFKSKLYEDFCYKISIEKGLSDNMLGQFIKGKFRSFLKKYMLKITEELLIANVQESDPYYQELKDVLEEE